MKKLITFIFFIISIIGSKSQDLVEHVPADALMVIKINIPNIRQSLPLTEFRKSSFGSEILKGFSKEFDHELNSYADMGIDTEKAAYFFSQKNGNQNNFVYLIPISDRQLFENLIKKNNSEFVSEESISYSHEKGVWIYLNNSMLSIVVPENTSNTEAAVRPANYLTVAPVSITTNKAYQSQIDNTAAASFWINDFSEFAQAYSEGFVKTFSGLSKELNGMMQQNTIGSMYKGFQSISMKLYLENDNTRLSGEVNFSKENAKNYKKISNQKFNSNFFNYVNLNDCVGYYSVNISVQNFLLEFPTLYRNQIGGSPSAVKYKDEMDLSISLLSTMLDEEAIGEIIRGDLLIVLSDISTIEMEYTTYEYDSNYNKVPVKKTKSEKIPDFIAMASTKEGELSEVTINYFSKKGLIEDIGGFYRISNGKSVPMDLYFLIKNNILFLGTNKEQFQSISSDRLVSYPSSKFQDDISNNQVSFYAGVKKVAASFEASDFRNEREFTETRDMLQESPEVYFTVGKIKGNTYSSSLTVKNPKGHNNGLAFLLEYFDKFK